MMYYSKMTLLRSLDRFVMKFYPELFLQPSVITSTHTIVNNRVVYSAIYYSCDYFILGKMPWHFDCYLY